MNGAAPAAWTFGEHIEFASEAWRLKLSHRNKADDNGLTWFNHQNWWFNMV
jgi:hypothetical protein